MRLKLIRASTVAISLDVLLRGQLAYLNQYFNVVAVSGKDVHLEKVREREGVKIISIPMERAISPIKDLISLIKLYRLFTKEAPDIVHSITPKAGLLCMAAAYFAKVPIRIHTFTGLIFPYRTGLSQFLLLNLDKLLCFFATHVYPEGEGVKRDLINYKVTNKELKVLANGNVNGIDINYFDPKNCNLDLKKGLRQQNGIGEKDFVFIFIGRLVSDKGINELVSAFEALTRRYTNIKLLLVGSFEFHLDPLNKNTLDSIEKNKDIIAVGFQPDIKSYLSIANALVLPSYREGFPNVVIQAGAMSLPCIVTDINGCNEIIKEGVNGTIISTKSEGALLHAMEKFVKQKDGNLIKLANNARRLVVERYEQNKVWNALLEEYNQLVDTKELQIRIYNYH